MGFAGKSSMALGGIGVVLLFLAAVGEAATGVEPGHVPPFARSSFPAGFVFGAASSAHQVEGAANEGGRGPSIWDTFTHKRPEMIADRSTADVAIDSYHRYKEDVGIMKNIGLDAYRFSFSWSRIIPTGSLSGGVNKEGIQYYNNLINELLAKGVQPYVTLLHWDVPQGLEDKYGGFRSPLIVNDFRDYADVCFKEFGDRVKKWITLNEPWSFSQRGYAAGVFAPGRCSPFVGSHCTVGDSSREPYLVAHHMLLAHAAAVKQYKTKYQASQKGQIGITLVSNWFLPYSNTKASQDSVQRALDFMFGWFMDPLTQGDYPFTMRALVGDRLPPFTETQSEMVKGSYDFLGLNYYTSNYANTISLLSRVNVSYDTDIHAVETGVRNGVAIGPQATGSDWLYIYPRGLRDLLLYIKNNYNNPNIYITENGVDEPNNATLPLEEALKDKMRIDYHYRHLLFVNLAIKEGVNVKGYFAWTLFDDFEWDAGFTVRFGLNFVDFKNGLKRYPKHSAFWYQKFLKG